MFVFSVEPENDMFAKFLVVFEAGIQLRHGLDV
jgi:hypothetical protein